MQIDIGSDREEDRGLGGAHTAGCAAGGFPSGLDWEVGLTCLSVVSL